MAVSVRIKYVMFRQLTSVACNSSAIPLLIALDSEGNIWNRLMKRLRRCIKNAGDNQFMYAANSVLHS